MTAAETTACSTVDTEVTVADLDDIGGSTASGTISTTVPAPAVFRDKTAAASAESIIFALTLGNCRGVVDKRCANLRVCGCGQCHGRKNAI